MSKKDPRVDEYISEAAPFARPVLKHIRAAVHRGFPKIEETIKWNVPFFMYEDKIVCVMAAFKAHCNFGFWKGRSILNADGSRANVGMGQLGRITSVKDLPSSKAIAGYLKQAIALNEKSSQVTRRAPKSKKVKLLRLPPNFGRALRANSKAWKVFTAFSPSKQRDYIEWIVEAKLEETRERRIETAVDWISQGKDRQWKYRK